MENFFNLLLTPHTNNGDAGTINGRKSLHMCSENWHSSPPLPPRNSQRLRNRTLRSGGALGSLYNRTHTASHILNRPIVSSSITRRGHRLPFPVTTKRNNWFSPIVIGTSGLVSLGLAYHTHRLRCDEPHQFITGATAEMQHVKSTPTEKPGGILRSILHFVISV